MVLVSPIIAHYSPPSMKSYTSTCISPCELITPQLTGTGVDVFLFKEGRACSNVNLPISVLVTFSFTLIRYFTQEG